MIDVKCPGCGKAYRVKDDNALQAFAGKKVKCPACAAIMEIPRRVEISPTALETQSAKEADRGTVSMASMKRWSIGLGIAGLATCWCWGAGIVPGVAAIILANKQRRLDATDPAKLGRKLGIVATCLSLFFILLFTLIITAPKVILPLLILAAIGYGIYKGVIQLRKRADFDRSPLGEKKGIPSGFVLAAIAGVILLVVIVAETSNPGSTNSTSSDSSTYREPREAVYNSSDGSVYEVKEFLKKNLRDPDSYQSITWYNVIKKNGPDTASNGATYLYIVKHKYRAKNAFGGYMIADDYFYLDAQGNVVDWVNNPG